MRRLDAILVVAALAVALAATGVMAGSKVDKVPHGISDPAQPTKLVLDVVNKSAARAEDADTGDLETMANHLRDFDVDRFLLHPAQTGKEEEDWVDGSRRFKKKLSPEKQAIADKTRKFTSNTGSFLVMESLKGLVRSSLPGLPPAVVDDIKLQRLWEVRNVARCVWMCDTARAEAVCGHLPLWQASGDSRAAGVSRTCAGLAGGTGSDWHVRQTLAGLGVPMAASEPLEEGQRRDLCDSLVQCDDGAAAAKLDGLGLGHLAAGVASERLRMTLQIQYDVPMMWTGNLSEEALAGAADLFGLAERRAEASSRAATQAARRLALANANNESPSAAAAPGGAAEAEAETDPGAAPVTLAQHFEAESVQWTRAVLDAAVGHTAAARAGIMPTIKAAVAGPLRDLAGVVGGMEEERRREALRVARVVLDQVEATIAKYRAPSEEAGADPAEAGTDADPFRVVSNEEAEGVQPFLEEWRAALSALEMGGTDGEGAVDRLKGAVKGFRGFHLSLFWARGNFHADGAHDDTRLVFSSRAGNYPWFLTTLMDVGVCAKGLDRYTGHLESLSSETSAALLDNTAFATALTTAFRPAWTLPTKCGPKVLAAADAATAGLLERDGVMGALTRLARSQNLEKQVEGLRRLASFDVLGTSQYAYMRQLAEASSPAYAGAARWDCQAMGEKLEEVVGHNWLTDDIKDTVSHLYGDKTVANQIAMLGIEEVIVYHGLGAVFGYTRNEMYKQVNGLVRNYGVSFDDVADSENKIVVRDGTEAGWVVAMVSLMSTALHVIPAKEDSLYNDRYRDSGVKADTLDRILNAGLMEEQGFTSTSTERVPVGAFSHDSPFASAFTYGAPETQCLTTGGRNIADLSEYSDEKEVLYTVGARFAVTSIGAEKNEGRELESRRISLAEICPTGW